MLELACLMVGNPVDGYRLFGPFDSLEDAEAYAGEFKESWYISGIELPQSWVGGSNNEVVWHNNYIQFARLIEEVNAAGGFRDQKVMNAVMRSMDTGPLEIIEIINRASNAWELIKEGLTSG